MTKTFLPLNIRTPNPKDFLVISLLLICEKPFLLPDRASMAMAAASSLFRRISGRIDHIPPLRPVLPSSSSSLENLSLPPPPPPVSASPFSMDLMAVPKKKVSKYKKGLRNGPRALKPVPVIVRCKGCGRVKLPHFYCCSGDRGAGSADSSST